MKTLSTISLILALASGLHAAEPAHRVKILKIEGLEQKSPQFQVDGPRDKVAKSREWIEIEAEVEVQTTDPSGFIPELEASWYAVVLNKDKKPVRLMGKCVFKNIRTEEKKVFLSAYIEPETLERFTGKPRPSESDIEGYALTLSGTGIVTDKKYAEGLAMATDKEEAKWWVEWKHESFDGLIVPKSKTPFASLWTQRYPSEMAAKE
jgi:hypothetical protein